MLALSHRLRVRRDERGQALAEIALVTPILAMLVLAIYQFGMIFSNYIDVTEASRQAARSASTWGAPTVANSGNTTAGIAAGTSAAQASASSLYNGGSGPLTVNLAATGSWAAGNPVTATVTYPYSLDIIGFTVLSGTLTSSTTMRIEKH
jgi:Flp pilus assembly protein TadG